MPVTRQTIPKIGKLWLDDNDLLRPGMALHDLIRAIPCARGDVGKSFAAGYANLGGFAAPAQEKIAIGRFDFVERQPFKLAVIELANIILDQHW